MRIRGRCGVCSVHSSVLSFLVVGYGTVVPGCMLESARDLIFIWMSRKCNLPCISSR